jgi:hypothetical protein
MKTSKYRSCHHRHHHITLLCGRVQEVGADSSRPAWMLRLYNHMVAQQEHPPMRRAVGNAVAQAKQTVAAAQHLEVCDSKKHVWLAST